MRAETSGIRLSVLGITVLVLFSALFGRLWFLQVAASPGLEQRVVANRIRTVQLLPVRGRILDRQGRVLADNRRALSVVIDQSKIRRDRPRAEIFQRLAGVLQVQPEDLEARYDSDKYNRLLPLPLAEDVSEQVAGFLAERSDDYPGVMVNEEFVRSYRFAPIGSQIVGYMGQIQLESAELYEAKGYEANEVVGVAGVEQSFQDILRGTPGFQKVEIDSLNRVVRTVEQVDPVAGRDIQLTIDLKLQTYAEQIVLEQLQRRRGERALNKVSKITGEIVQEGKFFAAPVGSTVVQDTRTGEILAMASLPTFDNRWFSIGTSPAKLNALFGTEVVDGKEKPRFNGPLFSRAISGQYQIGSTMKLLTATAAMRYTSVKTGEKILPDPYAKFEDRGTWQLPEDQCDTREPGGCSKRNAGGAVYGPVNLADALAVSSDAYFYELGARLWIETEEGSNALQTELRAFGFGRRSGVDLPGEQPGLVPDADVKKELARQHVITRFEGSRYFTGDNVNLGIGQGLLGVTPLQLTNAYAAFANGGTLLKPQIARGIWEPGSTEGSPFQADFRKMTIEREIRPEVLATIDVPPEMVKPIVQGLEDVVRKYKVNGQVSTAGSVFESYDLEGYPVWGKTGTAQTGNNEDEKDTSLFTGVGGPAGEAPHYAITAVMEEAGFGARAAAPVVRCLFEALRFPDRLPEPSQSYPLDPNQTLPAVLPALEEGNTICLNIVFGEARNVID